MVDKPREEEQPVDREDSPDPGEPIMQPIGESDPGPPDMDRIALGGREGGDTRIVVEEIEDV